MQELRNFCFDHGFHDIPTDFTLDGKIHRFSVKNRCWYWGLILHNSKGEAYEAFSVGNWKTGESYIYKSTRIKSSIDKAAHKKLLEDHQRKLQLERQKNALIAANTAVKILANSTKDVSVSEYVQRKKIKQTDNIFIKDDFPDNILLIPCYTGDNELIGIQRIWDNGDKRFLFGQTNVGVYHVIGKIDSNTLEFFICEGYATGNSIYQATGIPVVVAFQANNLTNVTKAFRLKFATAKIIICGDDDFETFDKDGNPSNAGKKYALEASKMVCTEPLFPIFANQQSGDTDFNDLHIKEGLESLRLQLQADKVIDQGFLCLGSNDKGRYYFYSYASKTIIETSSFKKEDLFRIAPIEHWQSIYGNGKGVIDFLQATSELIDRSNELPLFNATLKRGCGIWRDGNRTILNTGDDLFIDGQRVSLNALKSKYFYLKSLIRIDPNSVGIQISKKEIDLILDISKMFNFKEKSARYFLLGWLATARICGALQVRPNIWLTGSRGTGKSTILEQFCQPLLGDPNTYKKVTGTGTTEAGIRAIMDSNAVPLIIDEFEVESEHMQANSNVLQLIRQAYSGEGGRIIKGTQNGGYVEFKIVMTVLLSSIRISLTNDADKSRFTILNLEKQSDSSHWYKLNAKLIDVTPELGDKLFARSYHNINTIIESCDVICRCIAKLEDQRFSQQSGMLLAGYWSIISDKKITQKEAMDLLQEIRIDSIIEEKDNEQIGDEYELLDHILTTRLTFSVDVGFNNFMTWNKTIEELLTFKEATEQLKAYGICNSEKENKIYIANNHAEFKKLLKGTKWYNDWKTTLRRLSRRPDYAKKRFGGMSLRHCVEIDYSVIEATKINKVVEIKKEDDYTEPLPF